MSEYQLLKYIRIYQLSSVQSSPFLFSQNIIQYRKTCRNCAKPSKIFLLSCSGSIPLQNIPPLCYYMTKFTKIMTRTPFLQITRQMNLLLSSRPPGGGGGSGVGVRVLDKIFSGRLRPEVQPLRFYMPFLTEKGSPFVYLVQTLCIPVNCCKFPVFEM